MSNQRNELFLQFPKIIWWIIKCNWPLIQALSLDKDDVFQDLSIAALKAIDKFDESRGCSMSTFIAYELQYEMLKIKRRHKLHGLTNTKKNTPDFYYLDKVENGAYPLEIPDNAPYDKVIAKDIIGQMTAYEAEVICQKIEGFLTRKKTEKEALNNAAEKTKQYLAYSNY